MALTTTNIAPHEIKKEGSLQAKSKYLRSWQPRWIVLTTDSLYTFEKEKEYSDPTEIIELSTIKSIVKKGNNFSFIFCIKGNEFFYSYFKCITCSEQQDWINIIKGYMNAIQVSVTVECEQNTEYCCNLSLSVPYHKDYKYKINTLIADVVKYAQHKHHPIKLYATNIKKNSFIGSNVYDWEHCTANIMDYPKENIISKGLAISINIANKLCPNMTTANALCPIYAKMRYQNVFTDTNLSHLFEYNHFENELIEKTECQYGENCYSYKRLLDGGNELKDRCHVKLYRHHHIGTLHTIKSSKDAVQSDILKNVEVLYKINDKLQSIDITKWKKARDHAIQKIITLADSLETAIRDIGIAKTAGGGLQIVGGALAVAGMALAPLSGGTSLALSIAGTSVALGGSATSLISDIVKNLKEKGTVKECMNAYDNIQPDTRKIVFLLDDYDVIFNATRHNISICNSLYLAANAVSNGKGILNLINISKAMKGYNALKVAANFTKAHGIKHAHSVLFGKLKFGHTMLYHTGSVAAKSFGFIGGGLCIVGGILEIVDGIKTIKQAENAIHQFRILAIEIDTQTERIMDGYNKVLKIYSNSDNSNSSNSNTNNSNSNNSNSKNANSDNNNLKRAAVQTPSEEPPRKRRRMNL